MIKVKNNVKSRFRGGFFYTILLICLVCISLFFAYFYIDEEKASISFGDFNNQVTALLSQYKTEICASKTLNIEDVIDDNGEYYLSINDYLEFSHDTYVQNEKGEFILQNEENKVPIKNLLKNANYETGGEGFDFEESKEELIDLYNTATIMGYELSISVNQITLSKPYQTKRIVVKSNNKINSFGAIATVEGCDDYHIFQYKTEEETKYAYEKLKKVNSATLVQLDSVVIVASTTESANDLTTSYKYKTWGANVMNANVYSNYLLQMVLYFYYLT